LPRKGDPLPSVDKHGWIPPAEPSAGGDGRDPALFGGPPAAGSGSGRNARRGWGPADLPGPRRLPATPSVLVWFRLL